MEGVSQEAITLAGHLGLSRLVVLFDDNGITIDGETELTTRENQLQRFEAAGWNVLQADGHDPAAIRKSFTEIEGSDRPTMIAFRTTIGFGADGKAGTDKCHGSPLGDEHINVARNVLDWPHAPFEVPEPLQENWKKAGRRGVSARNAWQDRLNVRSSEDQKAFLEHVGGGDLSAVEVMCATATADFVSSGRSMATRVASGKVLEHLTAQVPALIGGSADLTGSVNTRVPDMMVLSAKDFSGRYMHYGVREHGMAAAMNGMALHSGYVPYSGTFLVFAGYMLGAIRLSALMKQKAIYVLTHDSVGLGEDGPTHQPVETLAQLRALPGLAVIRPGDPVEVAEAWQAALTFEGPSAIVLSRQNVALLREGARADGGALRGGYVLAEADGGRRDVTLIGTGSELALAVQARDLLAEDGICAAVVSMPSFELFAAQSAEWQSTVLGSEAVPRVAVEAALRFGWDGLIGRMVGLLGWKVMAPPRRLRCSMNISV